MKVLVVTGIFPPDTGGPASYVPAISRGLRDLGHEIVAVVTLSDKVDHDDSCYGFTVARLLRARFRPIRWIQTILLIRRFARLADVVYLNGLVLEGILATKVLGRRPVVIKVVGDLIWEKARNANISTLELDDFQTTKLPLYWNILRWLQRWYTARADAIITPSQYLATIVRGWGVDVARVRTLYNAIDVPHDIYNPSLKKYDLVTVARLVPWKGISTLIEVAAVHGWSLRIVGDGPLFGELEALARQLSTRVSFAGHVAPEQVPNEIRSARLFVLNSSYEGLPHVVLEAKAVGVAVLATDAGGTPETIHHGADGWLSPVGDRTALAAGIGLLLGNDAERIRLAEAGRRQVVENFSFSTLTRATAAVLERVSR